MEDKVKQVVKKVVDAVTNVLGTMAMVEVKVGKPYLKKENSAHGDISGIIGFSSPNGKNKGSMSVTFTEQSALGVIGQMLGEEFTELNKDVIDAVGELTNMISGQARRGMDEIGMTFEAGIPSVVTGKNHSISHVSNSAILAIPFESQFGPIIVEICFA
ncbi:chemotaxis protein CheX [Desulfonauticus submarinus]|uniref:Chemotaxis protein CheX n=1 Tax=Desulfonauticus submarinus TaxID=206665 RepID=A0A1G9ZTB0_9BACT|nr:chemotaxis protein CheX [Desulfonauticus submarinus]SDN24337.1 chemotaxis protein CheX [Desulfonauticus submarinus]